MKVYCCDRIERAIASKDNPIEYDPVFREYDVRLIYNTAACEEITYCPWCGYKLPMPLRDSFFDILESEYEIRDSFSMVFDNKKYPKNLRAMLGGKIEDYRCSAGESLSITLNIEINCT